MSNILNFLSEEVFAEKMDRQNELLEYLVRLQNGESLPPANYTYAQMQHIVRLGLGASFFPIGAQISVKKGNGTLVFDVVAHNVAIPADTAYSHSMTLMMHNCPYILMFDNKEPNNTDSNRKNYGNNRYAHSAIRQWLNSAANAGSWWSSKHTYDAAPDYANTKDGFMKGIDSEFLAVIGKTKIIVAKNTVTDGGGSETLSDEYFYLPSTTEVGLANENNIAEGALFPYFDSNDKRIKYNASGSAQYYWLRTPSSGYSGNVRYVSTSGTLGSNNAYNAYGVAPACNII